MTTVKAQYEAYPYPERDPADEARRLVTGSPSHPLEIDHFLFDGCRDWSQPLRVLVAGGGTGDGLIQIAALMKQAGRHKPAVKALGESIDRRQTPSVVSNRARRLSVSS